MASDTLDQSAGSTFFELIDFDDDDAVDLTLWLGKTPGYTHEGDNYIEWDLNDPMACAQILQLRNQLNEVIAKYNLA